MSLHNYSATDINGNEVSMKELCEGKLTLVVNTASECGFTRHYEDMQKLFAEHRDAGFTVVAFPSNQFGGQEPGDAEQIKNFCTENFGVSFIITEKITAKGPDLHPIYAWLTDKKLNGKINSTVKWNFQKYLLNKEGKLIDYFNSSTSPMSSKITSLLN